MKEPTDEQLVYDINDFDIEAAISVPARASKDKTIIAKLQAAIPKVRDWDGVEPLAVGHRVRINHGVVTIMLPKDSDDLWTTKDTNGVNNPTELTPNKNCFPITPPVKKIDHSSLVGSGIDVILHNGQLIPENLSITATSVQKIRMNHLMVLTDEQLAAIPDGYDVKSSKIPESMFKGDNLVTVTGILDNWEL